MLERVALFDRQTLRYFLLFITSVFIFSLLIEYQKYTRMIAFDRYESDAKVLLAYAKTKQNNRYTIAKIRLDNGAIGYIKSKRTVKSLKGKRLHVRLFLQDLSFFAYLKGTFYISHIQKIVDEASLRDEIADKIASLHVNKEVSSLYQALYLAYPLSKSLRQKVSALGVAHLVAISGYHLSLIAFFILLILKRPYQYMQHYFPYRNRNRDLFMVVAILLFSYAYFIDFTPSVTRAMAMLIVGYVLYDRGIELISLQSLLMAVALLIAFFPKLLLSIGFWLSVMGVYYIMLFLRYFSHINKVLLFIVLHIWVYLCMLVISLYLFETFSLYHPFSILFTMLFNLFYPLSILAHLIGQAERFDTVLIALLHVKMQTIHMSVSLYYLLVHLSVSLLAYWYKYLIYPLAFLSLLVLFIEDMTQF